jgi:TonB family protein
VSALGRYRSAEATLDSAAIQRILFQIALARRAAPVRDSGDYRETVEALAEQLTLRAGRHWKPEAAALAYDAARAAAATVDSPAIADTAWRALSALADSSGAILPAPRAKIDSALARGDAVDNLDALLRTLFAFNATASRLMAEFALQPAADTAVGTDAIEGVVHGLVYDSAAAKQPEQRNTDAPAQRAIRRAAPDNPARALAHRPQESIMRSIEAHNANLEALYRKQLKINQDMEGVVYVTFRVSPDGTVLSASIKSSDIADPDFLDPFLDYVTTIRFEPIPERVGKMRFDFPFEFRPGS